MIHRAIISRRTSSKPWFTWETISLLANIIGDPSRVCFVCLSSNDECAVFFFLVLFILFFVSCLRQCAARTVQECAEVDFTFSKKSSTATAMTNWYRCWYAMPEWIGNSLRATRAARHAWHMEQNTHNTTQVQAERMVEETTYHDIMTE